MEQVFDFLFSQYSQYQTIDIILELTGVIFGFLSVWYSKQNNILVFPTGIISTSIFVYLLYKFQLLGDMLINAYYFLMSIYGWYIWTLKVDETHVTPISYTSKKERALGSAIFLVTIIFVYLVYTIFDKWSDWTAYVDTLTTAIFFVGMWYMAKRKVENWIFWIVGNLISIPLYFYKGLTLTSIQYFGFTFLAIYGYMAWRKIYNNNQQTL